MSSFGLGELIFLAIFLFLLLTIALPIVFFICIIRKRKHGFKEST